MRRCTRTTRSRWRAAVDRFGARLEQSLGKRGVYRRIANRQRKRFGLAQASAPKARGREADRNSRYRFRRQCLRTPPRVRKHSLDFGALNDDVPFGRGVNESLGGGRDSSAGAGASAVGGTCASLPGHSRCLGCGRTRRRGVRTPGRFRSRKHGLVSVQDDEGKNDCQQDSLFHRRQARGRGAGTGSTPAPPSG